MLQEIVGLFRWVRNIFRRTNNRRLRAGYRGGDDPGTSAWIYWPRKSLLRSPTRCNHTKSVKNGTLYIEATIYVERESQKGIVIGRKGQMIREIGTKAREELERVTGQNVFLELVVKVQKDWKNDQAFLKQIGLSGG